MLNNVTIAQFRSFVAVATHGSFASAAEYLEIKPSALTVTIQRLEAELGVMLFRRTTRRVELTTQGIALLPRSQRILRDFDDVVTDMVLVGTGERGSVSLSATWPSHHHLVAPIMEQFVSAHPDVAFSFREDTSGLIENRVKNGDCELGISGPPILDPALEFEPLLSDRLCILIARDHPLAADDEPIAWNELSALTYLPMGDDSNVRLLLQNHPVEQALLVPSGNQIYNVDLLAMLLNTGNSFCVLTELWTTMPMFSDLGFRVLTKPEIHRPICLVTRRDRELSSAASQFASLLRESCRQMRVAQANGQTPASMRR